MSYQMCQGCGGVIGRDCFNSLECLEITRQQAELYREYSLRCERHQSAMHAVESIIDNWDEWEADAGQQAQIDQDDRTWRHVMRTHIANCLWRSLGWPMGEGGAET